MLKKLLFPLPIYVTNPNADGLIAQYTVPLIAAVTILFLFMLNALGWGAVGVVELVRLVTG